MSFLSTNNAGTFRYMDRTSLVTGAKAIGNNTLAAWFNVANLTANHEIVEINDSVGGGFASAIEYDTAIPGLVFLQRNAAGSGLSFSTAITANVWTHAALTWDGTTLTGYINGASVGSANTLTGARNNWGILQIGPAQANIQDVVFYDAALSAQEILQLMNARQPKRRTNLQIHMPCFAGATARIVDYSGNGNNFANNNTPTDGTLEAPVGWGSARGNIIIPTANAGLFTAAGVTQVTGSAQLGSNIAITASGLTQTSAAANVNLGLGCTGNTQTSGAAAVGITYSQAAAGLTQTSGAATEGINYAQTANGVTQVFGGAAVSGGGGVVIANQQGFRRRFSGHGIGRRGIRG